MSKLVVGGEDRSDDDGITICERGLGVSPWDPHKMIHVPSFWLSTPDTTSPIGTTADGPTGQCD